MKRYVLFIFSFLICSLLVRGQTQKAYITEADKAFEDENFYAALVYYSNAIEFDTARTDLYYMAAQSARMFDAYNLADSLYETVMDRQSDGDYPEAVFYRAVVNQRMGHYDQAQRLYDMYLSEYSEEGAYMTQRARKEREACSWAMELSKAPRDEIELTRLEADVNTANSEFGSTMAGDSLYFSSMRFIKEEDDYEPERTIAGVLLRTGDQTVSELQDFNVPDKHTANTALSPDGKTMYFTICDYVEGARIRCDLYSREKQDDGSWGEPEKLPEGINVDSFTNTQPNVARFPDGKTWLLFVSNRDGGEGKKDIYAAEITEDGYGEPMNLEDINTPEDDITPFYNRSTDQLYFSSRGYQGLGGFDVYFSTYSSGEWGEAVHTGVPINSSYDDVYYVRSEDGSEAYLSSNRSGSQYIDEEREACCYDIYHAKYLEFVDLIAMTFEAGSMDSLRGAEVSLRNLTDKSDTAHYDIDAAKHVFPLKRYKEYELVARKEGYYPDTIRFSTDNVETMDDIVKKMFLVSEMLALDVNTFDAQTSEPLLGAVVRVVEEDKPETRVDQLNPDSNDFHFDLERNKEYIVIASRKGYKPASLQLNTGNFDDVNRIERNMYLERGGLADYLPLVLFFDNDKPLEDSWETYTNLLYHETYPDYAARRDTFLEVYTEPLGGEESEQAEKVLSRFFELEVKKGNIDFKYFLGTLQDRLEKGSTVEIFLKGYTSPRAGTAYNYNLGKRRVVTVKNEFLEYNEGALRPFLRNGQLKIKERSFGEVNAPPEVSDDLDDPRNSIFSLSASKERRVEIIQIKIVEQDE